jgi:aspartyl-tRNA(Asn)/glutamyl-tRNA(Gln) amidotransferase subunit A
MTRSVEDAAIMLQAIAGYDANEVTSCDAPVEDYVSKMKLNIPSLRVGIPRNFFYDGLDPEIQEATERALASLEKLGTELREFKMEVNGDRAVVRAEAYAWHSENVAKHPELYLPETLAKLQLGASIEAATYIKARHQVEQLRREIPKLFATVDVFVTPTTPVPPPKAADLPTKFEEILAEDTLLLRNTRTFDLSGLPTISVPCGFTKAGLPIGLQISGAPWQEAVVLRLALAYQQATSWHLQHPGHPAEPHSGPAGNSAFV